jgi:hypothetical protein
MQRLIIKSIAQMNAAVLLQIDALWKNIMRKRLSGKAQKEHVPSVKQGLVDITNLQYALVARKK